MLKEELEADLKKAMLARDEVRTRTLRSLRAALLDKEIEMRSGGKVTISDDIAQGVLHKQAKQRRDSIEQFLSANRHDLASTEQEELEVIEGYLPEQLSEDEVRNVVTTIVQETGAESMKDMGRVMGQAMNRLKGKADGRLVQAIVRELLTT
jgi:uncharacterized protein YqeY